MKINKSNFMLILLIGSFILGASMNRYLTFLSTLATINAISVLGIVLISGFTGQLNLGQSAFVGIGAYTVAIMSVKYGFSFWLAFPVSMFVCAFFGILMGIPALKLKGGPYLALVTQTFGEIIFLLIINLEQFTGGPFGILGIPYPSIGGFTFSNLKAYFLLCIIFLIICYWLCWRVVNSSLGLVFTGIRESEDAEQSLGINTMYYKIMSFAIAAVIGGIAGNLYAPFIGYISADQFRWYPSLLLVSMAIVGGMHSLGGGILGAITLTFLPEMLRLTDQYRLILYGLLVIAMLALLPGGLVSLYGKSWSEIKLMLHMRIRSLTNRKNTTTSR
ncbi:branched-chain amino acid ABC transporter permease [Sporanaerobacter acetigenes]|uniref:branched-chain amino acid ABC transporter permease n=1 Tax=Sporanaerobacter acetigenes TaxID=165813 RepID=UPI00332DC5DC